MIHARLLAATIAAAVAAASLGAGAASAAGAKGSGATLPQPAYARWAALYGAESAEVVTYDGIGSGAGVKAIEGGAVTFGATDAPLGEADLQSAGLVQVPTLVGGIVPVVNLPGVGPGDLVLDGPALADLFLGRIAFWDDPALRGRNPHLPLPHLPVTVVRRSDRSGTTAVFVAYLATMPKLEGTPVAGSPPALPEVGVAAEGSEGVAKAVAATPGAVGYLGFDFAQARRLAYADLVNPAGRVVQPTLASIAAAAAAADWSHGLTASLVSRPGGASWPIASATYVLMRRTNQDDLAARTALKFLAWAYGSGGPAAEDLGFVPIPPKAEAEARRRLLGVKDAQGRSLAPPDATNPGAGAPH